MMRALLLALAIGSGSFVPAAAPLQAQQEQAPAGLAWFHGEWIGDVDFIGRPAKGRLVIGPGLSGTATVMAFSADVSASGERPAFRFEAQGTYRLQPDGRVTGLWADSYGNFHALKGRTKPGELRVNWGDARSEVGHSSYVLGPDGVLTVTDAALVQGEMKVFGTASYRRRP
jgi:hypothetical protein